MTSKHISKELLLIFFIVIIVAPFLCSVSIFAHEGGHGILVVPAIILNREIPEMPTVTEAETHEWNPFPNFPAGIFLMFLSFPLGIVANGLLSYLSYKNAKRYRTSLIRKDVIFLAIFLSFCIMNFSSVLSNFFGQDFAFMWEGIGFPYESIWFRYLIKIISYLVFPLFLATRKNFDIARILTVSVGTFAGSIVTLTFIFKPLHGMLMANFWWLFIIGLPVLIISVVTLWRLQKA